LKRVGCFTGSIDGEWSAASRRSLELFNKRADTKLDVKLASIDALDTVKAKPGRICPLICDSGYRADGDNCVRITCKAGFEIGDGNACERVKPKVPEKPITRLSPQSQMAEHLTVQC
jgi:hypothetical protein